MVQRGRYVAPSNGSPIHKFRSYLAYDRLGPDDYDVWVDLTVGSDYFGCPNCHLVLDGYELVKAAGLDEGFDDVGSPAEYPHPEEYGND